MMKLSDENTRLAVNNVRKNATLYTQFPEGSKPLNLFQVTHPILEFSNPPSPRQYYGISACVLMLYFNLHKTLLRPYDEGY